MDYETTPLTVNHYIMGILLQNVRKTGIRFQSLEVDLDVHVD